MTGAMSSMSLLVLGLSSSSVLEGCQSFLATYSDPWEKFQVAALYPVMTK